jgi:hypothetical protein
MYLPELLELAGGKMRQFMGYTIQNKSSAM